MSTISKDQSIIMQVAAKIAADLTPKTDDVQRNIADFLVAFDATTEALLGAHNMTRGGVITTEEQFVEAVTATFPNAQVVTNTVQMPTPQMPSAPASGFSVRIKGKQHGPIPEWLAAECAKKGVTEVWDNRDRLAQNPKRPWFKSTTTEDAFWAPRNSR
jgi:hypothetical protein